MDIQNQRREYLLSSLDFKDLKADPLDQFRDWYDYASASQVLEPNAMILSSIDEKGFPDSRVVLLKEITQSGFVFFTNYESNKGRQLARDGKCSLVFNWLGVERQVRIQGVASKISRERTQEYFSSRPKSSQIGAHVSPQSKPLDSRDLLEEKQRFFEEKYKSSTVIPAPENWGGYEVELTEIEFWQGRSSRLHDRFAYSRESNIWKIKRLAP